MLILSRKHAQKFQIGDDVTITVVKIDRNSVRIGIEATQDLTVRRAGLAGQESGPVRHARVA